MKKIIIGTLCMMCALVACTSRSENSTCEVETLPEDSLIEDELLDDWSKYINSVKGHKEQDSIVGRFVDNRIDTLWFEIPDMDNPYVWELCCSNPNVRRCKIGSLSPKLVFEGDLDDNGTDDFGYLDTWYTSNCRWYTVATIRNNTIFSMLDFETAYNLRASGKELVQKSNQKGYAHVLCSDLDSGCCNSAPDVDTLMRFEYKRIIDTDL